MTTHHIDKLRAVPVFAGLSDADLEQLAAIASEFEASHGHVIIERGQPGTGVFIIEEGSVRVDLPDGRHVIRGAGSFIGELSVLADVPRSARVSVEEDLRCLAIRRDELMALLDRQPAMAVAMLRQLAQRLIETTAG